MLIRNFMVAAAAAATIPALAACGDGGKSHLRLSATTTQASALHQGLAAAPLAGFEQICLNVESVRVRIKAEDEAGNGWHDLQLAPRDDDGAGGAGGTDGSDGLEPCPDLDLVQLLTGAPVHFAWGDVPSGNLNELRLILAEDQGYAIRSTGERVSVLVPSGSQSGLKLKGPAIALEPDEEQEVIIEFDADASIREHNGGGIRIRPVIRIRGTQTTSTDPEPNDPELL